MAQLMGEKTKKQKADQIASETTRDTDERWFSSRRRTPSAHVATGRSYRGSVEHASAKTRGTRNVKGGANASDPA